MLCEQTVAWGFARSISNEVGPIETGRVRARLMGPKSARDARGTRMNGLIAVESDSVALLAVASVGGVLGAYAVRVARIGRIVSSRLDTVRGTPLLGRYPIEAFHWVARGIGHRLSQSKVSPDTLTILSLVLTAFTLPLAAMGRFEFAGAMLLVGSAFDALDGIVARELGMASEAGEILDSVIDRYADAFCMAGLALFYRESIWILAIVFMAVLGSMMVSYVRAKAEKFGLSLPPTLMRRPERIAYLAAALLFGPLLSSWLFPHDSTRPVTWIVVGLIAVVSNVAAVELLVGARKQLRQRAIRLP